MIFFITLEENISRQYTYIDGKYKMDMYLSVMLKIPKQLSYKRTETNVVLVVFDGVLCEVCAYTVTVSYRCST